MTMRTSASGVSTRRPATNQRRRCQRGQISRFGQRFGQRRQAGLNGAQRLPLDRQREQRRNIEHIRFAMKRGATPANVGNGVGDDE